MKLEITLNVNSFEGEGSLNVPPPKSSNSINTIVTVPDNKTIILGGLTTQSKSTVISKVPLLGDLPLIGAAFRNINRSDTRAVLYVFVRANIVRGVGEEGEANALDRLSEIDLRALREAEERYNEQSVIPGISVPRSEDWRGVLDD